MNPRLDLLPPYHSRRKTDGAALGMAGFFALAILYFGAHLVAWLLRLAGY